MKTFEKNLKFTKAVCQLSVAALIAGTVMLPADSSAGVLNKAKGGVTVLRNKISAKVENVKQKAEDDKGAAIQQIIEMVLPMVQFIKKQQQGYEGFVGTDECGRSSRCGMFREKLRRMIVSFVTLPKSLPFVENVPPAVKQLEELAQLVGHMPAPMLYAAQKALSNAFDEVQYRLDMLHFAADRLPNMPSMAELGQAVNDASKPRPFCAAVLDQGKPHIELFLAFIKFLHETISDTAGLMQNEMTFGITAVGGGTISIKNPPKGALDLFVYLTKTMERNLTLKLALTKSVCTAAGYEIP